jgi:DNA-binding winged helix-turn-helix (wHTH) protein/alpha-beta hydrolase superfamily lysophospholipase
MVIPATQIYEFGPFRLDAAERRLMCQGQPTPLQDKLFDTLLALVSNAGRLLTKADLMRAVWPDANVEETNLSHNISMIRKLLGETRSGHQYVETIPKHGYRFVADVRTIEERRTASATDAPAIRRALPSTRYAKAGDVAVAYQVLGDGPLDLVYVPGWITHLEYGWEQPRVAHMLRRMASFSRLILFDKRGTGLSDRTQGYPTLDDRMDDVRAVMDAVKSERAAIFGMSEGGNMSMLFAATHPERTRALALYGTFAKRMWSPDYPWAPTPEERQRWYDLIETGWGGKADLDVLAPSLAVDEAFCEWWGTYLRLGASPGAVMALARFNTEIDTRDVLPAIQVPTLILHRAGDLDVKVDEGRYMAERIAGATFVELPGDDHLIYAGDVDRVIDEIERFLAALPLRPEVDRLLSTIVVIEGENDFNGSAAKAASLVARQCAAHCGGPPRIEAGRCIASFDRPGRAIRAARAIVDAARATGMALRAGIHTGECEVKNGVAEGPPVVVARGLAARAPGGAVLVTQTVTELVAGSPLRFEPRGKTMLQEAGGRRSIYEAVGT